MNDNILQLEKEKINIQKRINFLRENCKHIHYLTTPKSNTGNYDPTADSYWISVECLDCGKHMVFDAEDEPDDYRKYHKSNPI